MKVCRAYCVYVCVLVLGALLLSSCGVAVRDKLRQGLDLAFNPVQQAVSPDALAEGRAPGLMLFGASLLSYGKHLGGENETLLYDTCQGRTKTRPEWRRKIRPSGRPVACLKVAVRVG